MNENSEACEMLLVPEGRIRGGGDDPNMGSPDLNHGLPKKASLVLESPVCLVLLLCSGPNMNFVERLLGF